jgi:hypothetical protein
LNPLLTAEVQVWAYGALERRALHAAIKIARKRRCAVDIPIDSPLCVPSRVAACRSMPDCGALRTILFRD